MSRKIRMLTGAAILAAAAFFTSANLHAAESNKETAEFMKRDHKAPKGTDPVCKKATEGKASDAELAGLLKGYEAMCSSKPSKGDVAEWTKKCQALVAAVKSLQAKDASGPAAYKAAVNCKACHEAHRPEKAK